MMIGITYRKEGDYYIPDLYLEKENYKNDYQIGRYGHLRLRYLKNHKKAKYSIMLLVWYFKKTYHALLSLIITYPPKKIILYSSIPNHQTNKLSKLENSFTSIPPGEIIIYLFFSLS